MQHLSKRKKIKKRIHLSGKTLIIAAVLIIAAAVIAAILLHRNDMEKPESGSTENAVETAFLGVSQSGESGVDNIEPAEKLVRISEIMPKNRATLRDENGEFPDYIELFNLSDKTVQLAGWRLSDERGKEEGWIFPDTEIAPGEYMLVFADGRNVLSGQLHTDFGISAGETVYLFDPSGNMADMMTCSASQADTSSIKDADGETAITLYPSPGFANTLEGYTEWQTSQKAAGPLLINEVVVANRTGLKYNNEYPDWVEIKNVSSSAVNLADYYLSDTIKDPKKWRFPSRELAAGSCIIVLCDKELDCLDVENYLIADFSLNSNEEQLYLSTSSGMTDFVPLKDIPFECSFGRENGKNGFFYFSSATPGKDNTDGYRYVCAKPETTTQDGLYEDVDSIDVVLTGNGSIYYTTDGSLPTSASTLYSEPIVIDSTTVIRTVCCDGIGMISRPLTLSYFINEGHTLPVLSVVANDSKALKELYRRGLKGIELAGAIEYFENGSSFSIDCGIRMAGRASLGRAKKNLSFMFRGAYGQDRLDYDLFDGGINSFSALTLRSGHDSEKAVIRNEISEDLLLTCTDKVAAQRSKWVVMYMNGEYYGVFALKEKINEQFLADREGVSKESIEFEEDPTILSTEFYRTVILYCASHDMSIPENYEKLSGLLDIDSFIDWIILEQYTGNFDILYGNSAFYRSSELDHRWKAVFFDLDAAFTYDYYNFRNFFNIDYALNYYAQMLRSLLKNREFKEKYVSRVAELISGPLSNENVVKMMDEMYLLIDSEMVRDCVRWKISYSNYQKCSQNMRKMIIESDYEKHSIETVAYWTGLSEEERIAYFGQ